MQSFTIDQINTTLHNNYKEMVAKIFSFCFLQDKSNSLHNLFKEPTLIKAKMKL